MSLRTDKKGEGGAALSHGFGFVECSSEAVARAVLDALQVRAAADAAADFSSVPGGHLSPQCACRHQLHRCVPSWN